MSIEITTESIVFTHQGKVTTLRFNEVRVNGVLVSDMSDTERNAYIERTVEKIKRREAP